MELFFSALISDNNLPLLGAFFKAHCPDVHEVRVGGRVMINLNAIRQVVLVIQLPCVQQGTGCELQCLLS